MQHKTKFMKKVALLLTLAVSAFAANAQLTLTGTSYTQDFNSLTTSGIPTGWNVYNTASASALGTLDATYSNSTTWGSYYDTTGCPTDVFGTGFKNSASTNNTGSCTALCAGQQAMSDRCFAVRQSSPTGSHPGYDPGASFAFELANTTGMSGFNLNFKLMSLDEISPRVTTWVLDYGVGVSPTTFTPITATGTMTSGGSTCGTNMITAALPPAISNLSTPVWIRISALASTTGSGNRTTTGIDDFHLTWTLSGAGIKNVSASGNTALTLIGNATSEKMTFTYDVEEAGNYTLNIYDMTGRILHTENVNAQAGGQALTVSGLNLTPGMYIARIGNGSTTAIARVAIN